MQKQDASQSSPGRAAAQAAVSEAEALIREAAERRAAFIKKYPKASMELRAIEDTEDAARSAVAKAKPLVAAAKVSIGDFKVTQRFSRPGYDDDKVLEAFKKGYEEATNEEDKASWAEAWMEVTARGMVKSVKLDLDVTSLVVAQNPDLTEALRGTWVDRQELAPAVSVPRV